MNININIITNLVAFVGVVLAHVIVHVLHERVLSRLLPGLGLEATCLSIRLSIYRTIDLSIHISLSLYLFIDPQLQEGSNEATWKREFKLP